MRKPSLKARRFLGQCSLLLLSLCALARTGSCQTEIVGQRIELASTAQTSQKSLNYSPILVATDSGGVAAVFASRRMPHNVDNLYFQFLDAQGKHKSAMDALPICPQPSAQKNAASVSDGEGGFYVIWQERRGSGTRDKVFMQRVSHSGDLLWNLSGQAVSDDFYRQREPTLIAVPGGGVIAIWIEDRLRHGGTDLYAQYFSPSGDRNWTESGIPLSQSAGVKQNVAAVWEPPGYLFTVWEEKRGKKSWKLFGQKMNERGERQWNERGLPLTPEAKGNCQQARIAPDGLGGISCVYEQNGKGSQQTDLQLFRLSRYGDVLHQQAVCESVDEQTQVRLINIDSLLFIYWSDYRSGRTDIYGQCYDSFLGTLRWSIDGRPVVAREGDQKLLAAIPFGKKYEHALVWDRGGQKLDVPDLHITRLDSSSTWQSLPRALETPTLYGHRFQLAIAPTTDGGFWFCWPEVRSSEESRLRINRIDTDLALFWKNEAHQVLNPKAPERFTIENPTLTAGGNGEWFAAWADDRLDENADDIWMQRVNSRNQVLWPEGGRLVCGAAGLQSVPTLFKREPHLYVGWMDRRDNDDDLYLQRMNAGGSLRWAAGGLPLCTAKGTQNNLRLNLGPQGGVSAFWTDARNFKDMGFDLFQQVFDSSGTAFHAANGAALAATPDYQNNLTVSTDASQQELLCFWMDDRDGHYQIYGQIASLQGRPAGPPGGIRLGRANKHQRLPQSITADSAGTFVIWSEEGVNTGRIEVKLQGLRGDLSLCWNAEGLLLPTQNKRQTFPKLAASADRLYPAWLENNSSETKMASLHVSCVSGSGSFDWPTPVIKVADSLSISAGYEIARTGTLLHFFFVKLSSQHGRRLQWIQIDSRNGKTVQNQIIEPAEGWNLERFSAAVNEKNELGLIGLEKQAGQNDRLWFMRLR